MENNENFIIGGIGATISSIATISGLDALENLALCFIGGIVSVIGKLIAQKYFKKK
jgi:hypothetical protein